MVEGENANFPEVLPSFPFKSCEYDRIIDNWQDAGICLPGLYRVLIIIGDIRVYSFYRVGGKYGASHMGGSII